MEKIKVVVVEAGHVPYVKEIEHTLDAMQEIVGGYIETVTFTRRGRYKIICNEDGLRLRLRLNRLVNENKLVGTFFITRYNDAGECLGLTDEEADAFIEDFSYIVYDDKVYWK